MKINLINKLFSTLLLVYVFSMVVGFLPIFTDPFGFGRQILSIVFSFFLFVLLTLKVIAEKKLSIKKNIYLVPVFLIFIVYLLSSIFNTANKAISLSAFNGPLSLLLMYFLIIYINTGTGSFKKYFYPLILGSTLLSLFSLILFLANFKYPINVAFLGISINKAWSFTGSLVSQMVIVIVSVILNLSLIYTSFKEKKNVVSIVLVVANAIMLSFIGICIYLLQTEAKPVLLPQSTAWSIAVESIKNGRYALLGTGPGQFVNAFTIFKPVSFNQNSFWNLRFNSSSNWYYQTLTEVGIIGLVCLLNLIVKILKNTWLTVRKNKLSFDNLAVYACLIVFLIAQLSISLNMSLFFVFFLLLAITESEEERKNYDLSNIGSASIVFLIFPVIFWSGVMFFGVKFALADIYLLSSAKLLNKGNGVKAYDLQYKTTQINPYLPNYRIAYSQTNFALANSLAAKKDLTEQERATISQLVQQAIRESKSAVALDTNNIVAWENLSSLYKNLIGFAQDADKWAISSYQESLKYDPFNPLLRIELGGIYFSKKDYRSAVSYFIQATNLKPDYANGHYNLANALKEAGALLDAKSEYESTLSLVKAGTADYDKVSSELEDLKKKLPSEKPVVQQPVQTETSELTKPSTGKEETLNPPIKIPEENQPPISPTPTP